MNEEQNQPSLEELETQFNSAEAERQKFMEDNPPPLSQEARAQLDELVMRGLEARARYYRKRDNK